MVAMELIEAREKARSILADVLGLKGKTTSEGFNRPADEEDFYMLGGTSLMASIATELLRDGGFQVKLSLLITTGNIGRILDAIFQQNQPVMNSNTHHPPSRTPLEYKVEFDETREFRIRQWVNDGTKYSRAVYEEAREMVSTEFDRLEILGKAFGILKSDVENSFNMFNTEGSILLTLTYQPLFQMPLYGWVPEQILGVVVALPRTNLSRMPSNPQSEKLQKFFDQIEHVTFPEDVPIEKALTVMIMAVRTPELDPVLPALDKLMSGWNKLKVRILLCLEREILKMAKERGFPVIEAINTSSATKEACLELGYEIVKSLSLGEFQEQCNIQVDRCYHDHRSHYMIKRL